MSATSLVNNALQNPASIVSLQKAQRQSTLSKKQEKTAESSVSGAALVLPEDIVTLSSKSNSSTAKKASQPVTSDEKKALLDPNFNFSVYA
jgi:hypothetical protein